MKKKTKKQTKQNNGKKEEISSLPDTFKDRIVLIATISVDTNIITFIFIENNILNQTINEKLLRELFQ